METRRTHGFHSGVPVVDIVYSGLTMMIRGHCHCSQREHSENEFVHGD